MARFTNVSALMPARCSLSPPDIMNARMSTRTSTPPPIAMYSVFLLSGAGAGPPWRCSCCSRRDVPGLWAFIRPVAGFDTRDVPLRSGLDLPRSMPCLMLLYPSSAGSPPQKDGSPHLGRRDGRFELLESGLVSFQTGPVSFELLLELVLLHGAVRDFLLALLDLLVDELRRLPVQELALLLELVEELDLFLLLELLA